MTLIIGIGPVMYSLTNPDPQIQSLLFCKVRGYLFQICLMLSRWFVAFACIDRYAITSDKVRLRNFAKTKISYRVIVIIMIIWSIICSHRLIFYEIEGNVCGIVNNLGAALYHSAYVIVGGGVLPTVIMIICICLIRLNLKQKQQRRIQIVVVSQQRNSLDQQVLHMLFIQIICYIIFIIPQLCNLVFNTISITIPNRSSDHLAIEKIVAFIAELMLYLFPVTSFYLYTLTSRTFRNELMKFFRSLFIYFRKNQITPAMDGTTTNYRLEHMQTAMRAPQDLAIEQPIKDEMAA
jgi:hypothetical protein